MASWSDGLRWDAEFLRASAAEQRSHSLALGAAVRHVADSTTGAWEGAASQAASKSRQQLVDQGTDLVDQLSEASGTYAEASHRLSRLLSDMMATRDRALSDNFWITDSGGLDDLVTGLRKLDPRRAWIRTKLWSSVQSLVFRLTGFDVWFATQLGLLRLFGEAARWVTDGLISGAQFLGDRIEDGMDWSKDRWEDIGDLAGGVRDSLAARWNAFRAGGDRFWDAATDTPRWMEDLLLRGELPEISEVLATSTYLHGLQAGVVANLVTGEDQKFFADGVPFTGEPVLMSERDGRTFQDPGDWMRDMKDAYDTRGDTNLPERPSVEITVVENPGQPPRIILTAPGTTESLNTLGGWTGQPGGTDWSANLKGVGYGTTSSTQAMMDAVDKVAAQYPGASEIIMGGHSQGGIIVANMAADADFSSRYDIAGIMTAGSPIQTIPIPENIPVINLNNSFDPVPKVDLGGLGGTRDGGNVVDVPLRGGFDELSPGVSHLQDTYVDKAQHIMEPGQSHWATDEAPVHGFNSEIDHFYVTDGGKMTTYHVEVGRQDE